MISQDFLHKPLKPDNESIGGYLVGCSSLPVRPQGRTHLCQHDPPLLQQAVPLDSVLVPQRCKVVHHFSTVKLGFAQPLLCNCYCYYYCKTTYSESCLMLSLFKIICDCIAYFLSYKLLNKNYRLLLELGWFYHLWHDLKWSYWVTSIVVYNQDNIFCCRLAFTIFAVVIVANLHVHLGIIIPYTYKTQSQLDKGELMKKYSIRAFWNDVK